MVIFRLGFLIAVLAIPDQSFLQTSREQEFHNRLLDHRTEFIAVMADTHRLLEQGKTHWREARKRIELSNRCEFKCGLVEYPTVGTDGIPAWVGCADGPAVDRIMAREVQLALTRMLKFYDDARTFSLRKYEHDVRTTLRKYADQKPTNEPLSFMQLFSMVVCFVVARSLATLATYVLNGTINGLLSSEVLADLDERQAIKSRSEWWYRGQVASCVLYELMRISRIEVLVRSRSSS